MFQATDATTQPLAVMQPFVEFWMKCFEQVNEQTKMAMGNVSDNGDPQVWRRKWLDAATKSMDAFVRSPVFLEAMRQHMETVTQAKSQSDFAIKEFARNAGIPTTGDISGLFERLHSFEERLLGSLSEIEERLTVIEQLLVEPEEGGESESTT